MPVDVGRKNSSTSEDSQGRQQTVTITLERFGSEALHETRYEASTLVQEVAYGRVGVVLSRDVL